MSGSEEGDSASERETATYAMGRATGAPSVSEGHSGQQGPVRAAIAGSCVRAWGCVVSLCPSFSFVATRDAVQQFEQLEQL